MDPVLARLVAVAAVVLVTAAVGRVVAARRDRVRVVASPERVRPASGSTAPTRRATEDGDGGPTRTGPSAVLFGSPTCAPCDTVKILLREVERDRPTFTWRYVDAADHLDLARAHGVRRVPTLLVMDVDGAVVARSGGVPTRAELTAAVARAAGEATTTADRGVTDEQPAARSA